MNTVYVAICLCLPWFLSSVLCSFLSTGLLPPGLSLFLGTLVFLLLSQMGFFLITISGISLLVYKNAFDFWILTLYPAVLTNSFIKSSSFLVESLGFSIYIIMSPANNDSFASSFPIWMPSISFLVWLLWLGLPVLCWIRVVRAGMLVLFLISVGKL